MFNVLEVEISYSIFRILYSAYLITEIQLQSQMGYKYLFISLINWLLKITFVHSKKKFLISKLLSTSSMYISKFAMNLKYVTLHFKINSKLGIKKGKFRTELVSQSDFP